MSEYLRRLALIDPCVRVGGQTQVEGKTVSGQANLRDFLLSLDAMAHERGASSGDGRLTEEEFDYLKESGRAPTLKAFRSYSSFGNTIDEYIEEELAKNSQCICQEGRFTTTEAGPVCDTFDPVPPAKNKKFRLPPKPRKPQAPVKPKEAAPAAPPEEPWSLDPTGGEALPVSIDVRNPVPREYLELPSPLDPKRGDPARPSPEEVLVPWAKVAAAPVPQYNIWALPEVPRRIPIPCKPLVKLKPAHRLSTAEKIFGAPTVLVPQLGAVLFFLNDPGCYGNLVQPPLLPVD